MQGNFLFSHSQRPNPGQQIKMSLHRSKIRLQFYLLSTQFTSHSKPCSQGGFRMLSPPFVLCRFRYSSVWSRGLRQHCKGEVAGGGGEPWHWFRLISKYNPTHFPCFSLHALKADDLAGKLSSHLVIFFGWGNRLAANPKSTQSKVCLQWTSVGMGIMCITTVSSLISAGLHIFQEDSCFHLLAPIDLKLY